MTPTLISAFLTYTLITALTPGPNNILALSSVTSHGLRRSLRVLAGMSVGFIITMLICAALTFSLVELDPRFTLVLGWIGAAYILWLAWQIAKSKPATGTPSVEPVGFWASLGLQFVNVKAWLLALAIVAGWIVGFADPWARLAIVVPVMLVYAFASNLLYAAVGALLRSWLAQGQRLLWFNRAMALVLVLTAVWMAKA